MTLYVLLVDPSSVPAGEALYYNGTQAGGVPMAFAKVFDDTELAAFNPVTAIPGFDFDGERGFIELPSAVRKA